jgi:hypothetical protein
VPWKNRTRVSWEPPRAVLGTLRSGRLPCGNDANDGIVLAITVHNEQDSQRSAQAEQNEALLAEGVVRIVEQQGLLIIEHGLRFFEVDAVFANILAGLNGIPIEAGRRHVLVYGHRMYGARAQLASA